MELGASLSHENASGSNLLAGKPFYAIPFAGTVSAVPRTTACFFVCHVMYPLTLKAFYKIKKSFQY